MAQRELFMAQGCWGNCWEWWSESSVSMGPARTEKNHFHLFIQGKAYTFGILHSLLCKMEEIIGSSKVHHLTVFSPPWWSRIKIKTQLFTYPSHVSSREMNKHLIGRIQRHTGVQVTSEECTKCQVRDLNFHAEFDMYPNVNISAWFCWIFKVKRRWQIHKYPNNLYMSVLKYSNIKSFYVCSRVNIDHSGKWHSVVFWSLYSTKVALPMTISTHTFTETEF